MFENIKIIEDSVELFVGLMKELNLYTNKWGQMYREFIGYCSKQDDSIIKNKIFICNDLSIMIKDTIEFHCWNYGGLK